MDRLLKIGFRKIGTWLSKADVLDFELTDMASAAPVLYAFAIDGTVMYVGKSVMPLSKRMYGYKKGTGSQLTNIRVRNEILEALRSSAIVEIYAFVAPVAQRIGDFELNIPAGLEDDIIRRLSPLWNGGMRKAKIRVPNDQAVIAPQMHTQPDVATGMTSFKIRMGETYFNNGFFNVPISHSHKFGAHGADINLLLGGDCRLVTGLINRKANTGGSPRIFGYGQLRDWVQKNVKKGDFVLVSIEGPRQIHITVS